MTERSSDDFYARMMANLDSIEESLQRARRRIRVLSFLAGVGIASIAIDVMRWLS